MRIFLRFFTKFSGGSVDFVDVLELLLVSNRAKGFFKSPLENGFFDLSLSCDNEQRMNNFKIHSVVKK